MKSIQRFKDIAWSIYFAVIRKRVISSPADYLFIRQGHVSFSQLLICARILDIEEWYNSSSSLFHYTNALSNTLDKDFNEEAANQRFTNLLVSVEECGFRPDSRITFCDSFTVNDGTHRAALAYVKRMWRVPAFYIDTPAHWGDDFVQILSMAQSFRSEYQKLELRLNSIQLELIEQEYLCRCLVCNITEAQEEQVMLVLNRRIAVIHSHRINIGKLRALAPNYRKKLIGMKKCPQNGLLFSFTPLVYDYQCHKQRIRFTSINRLEKEIKAILPDSFCIDNFVDGFEYFQQIKDYLISY